MIQALIDTLLKYPRLDPKAKYNEVLSALKLVIVKDSNVVVVTLALHALTSIAKGLRRNFAKYLPMLLLTLLEKFKEKKATVKEAVVQCLAKHGTNPNVKTNVFQWIYYILCHFRPAAAPVAFIKAVAPYLIKHSSDGDPEVRERCFMGIGAVLRLLGEKGAMAVIGEVLGDKARAKKVGGYCAKAVQDFEAYEKARIESGLSMAEEPCASGDNKENNGALNGDKCQDDGIEVDAWELLTETKICDKLPNNMETMLTSKKWKERVEILEALLDVLEHNPRLDPHENHATLITALCAMLEKDTNVSVAALATKCIMAFAQGLRYALSPCIPHIYAAAFEKFKEKKAVFRQPLTELCDTLALFAPLSAYIEIVENALQKSNPQIREQTALFIARLLRQHSAQTIRQECVEQKLGSALSKLASDADSSVREASFLAIGALMRIVSESAINNYCGQVTQDKGKLAKVRESCENLKKEYGLNASAAILKLQNKTKPAVSTSLSGSKTAVRAMVR
ncbi:unnamed protein product [Gongylonema pulchrum]|uniref:TOG domain-containing protein n=1 Tax=Gongylonema pulchrum TaxID=637853 RepID=A0A183DRF9_9BILA|nr:unnamed protein product [Gongylonema pulchrum]